MGKTDYIIIFYIFGTIGVASLGAGFGNLFSCGVGWTVTGIGSLCIIPGGILFSNIINKYLDKD